VVDETSHPPKKGENEKKYQWGTLKKKGPEKGGTKEARSATKLISRRGQGKRGKTGGRGSPWKIQAGPLEGRHRRGRELILTREEEIKGQGEERGEGERGRAVWGVEKSRSLLIAAFFREQWTDL